MSMEAKTNFLNSLSDEQLGFFYAHEYNSNLEDILQDELTVKQFNLFRQWKEEEQKTDVLMDKLSSIESLLETLSSRQERMEEKLESIESNGMSNQMISKKIEMFEDFTARIAKLEATVVDKCLTGPVLDKLTEFELLFERTTNGIDNLQKKYESISTLIVNENKSIKEDLSIIMDRILRSDSRIATDVPLDAPTIDNSMNDGSSIFCVGGFDKPSRVQAYDSKNNKWISLIEMNERRCYPGLVGANGKLYAIGGRHYGSLLTSAEVFDSSSGTWSSIAPMNEPAYGLGVAYSKGVIYAIGGLAYGGWGSTKMLNKAEKYDIKLDTWTELPSMTAKRSRLGCAVLDGMVYAVGGYDHPNDLNSCERYNPRLNKWEAIASMEEKRSGLGLCVLNEFLYAVGGFNNGKTLASVERYDTNTNKWTKVAAMLSPRNNLSVAIMDGLMYAIGGQFDLKNLKSVEVYSPLLDEWSPAADLNEACWGGAAAWVDFSLDGLPSANKARRERILKMLQSRN